jgi:hypothetical protein
VKHGPTERVRAAVDAQPLFERSRRWSCRVIAAVRSCAVLLPLVLALGACSSDEDGTEQPSVNTILPDPTVPAPGDCDLEAEALSTPSIVIDGTATDATFGVGSYECGTLAGDGYIVFSYNPILLDANGSIEVVMAADDVPTFTWAGNSGFTETSPGHWASGEPPPGCQRLTIALASQSGRSTATYGADIRVGGPATPCPQRIVSPDDPSDTATIPTGPAEIDLDTIPTGLPGFSTTTTTTP